MKKGMCILLTIALLLSTVGCAASSGNASSKANSSKFTSSAASGSESSSESASASNSSGQTDTSSTVSNNADVSFETSSLTAITGSVSFDLTARADEKTALRNPDKGWYLHYYDNGTYNYGANKSAKYILDYIPYLDHVYMRLPWSTLEPKEGQFKWDIIDKVLKDFEAYGVGVSFRITCKEGGDYCPYATPEWVKKAGSAGETLSDGSWEPDYGDESETDPYYVW